MHGTKATHANERCNFPSGNHQIRCYDWSMTTPSNRLWRKKIQDSMMGFPFWIFFALITPPKWSSLPVLFWLDTPKIENGRTGAGKEKVFVQCYFSFQRCSVQERRRSHAVYRNVESGDGIWPTPSQLLFRTKQKLIVEIAKWREASRTDRNWHQIIALPLVAYYGVGIIWIKKC